jgi:hypothetical protein
MGLGNEINQRSSSPAAVPIFLQGKATLTQPPQMYVSEPFMKLTGLQQDHDMQDIPVYSAISSHTLREGQR